jgi:hypothetical protein
MKPGAVKLAMATAAVVVVLGALGATRLADRSPTVTMTGEASPELREVVAAAWDEFIGFFASRSRCIADVRVERAWELDDRARYSPAEHLIRLRVPGSAAQLEESLLHELAHHLELTCPDHQELRSAFLDAQGFAAGVDWFDAPRWENRPSEHFAETVVERLASGDRYHRLTIDVTPEAVAIVEQWAEGSLHPSSP